MKIDLTEIYKGLKAWRHERKITAESQKQGYIVNVMEELGELAQALRDYEKIKNGEKVFKDVSECREICSVCGDICYKRTRKEITLINAESEIIDAICDIAVFTINSAADIPCDEKRVDINTRTADFNNYDFSDLVEACGDYASFNLTKRKSFESENFNHLLFVCAILCEKYGYNFGIAMLETIKEINSRIGSYDESAKKWVKDTSPEAKSKWYKADYKLARIEK